MDEKFEDYPQEEDCSVIYTDVNKVNIKINEVLKGYVLNIGCQVLALTDANEVSTVVSYYLKNKQECHISYKENTLTELLNKVLGK